MRQDFLHHSSGGHPMGLSLYGSELPADTPCVLYLHGFKGFKDWGFVPYLGARANAAGLRLLAMNFSHNGIGAQEDAFTELDKFRDNTFSLELAEACETLNLYHSGALFGAKPQSRLGLIGHSRGGGIALLAAAATPHVECVCTWASVCNFARYPAEMIDKWRRNGVLEVMNMRTKQVMQLGWGLHEDLMANIEGKLSIRKAVESLTKPLCVIHGEQDEAVPAADARAIYSWADDAQAEMHILPKANHTFGAKHPWAGSTEDFELVLNHTLHFFTQQLLH